VFPGRTTIPIAFQLTDVTGTPIADATAQQLIAAQRVTVSASGVQPLAASPPDYDARTHTASFSWKPAARPNGAVTITISIISPNAPTQVVTIPIVLSGP
jgi:hypothetical protein